MGKMHVCLLAIHWACIHFYGEKGEVLYAKLETLFTTFRPE